MCYLICHPMSTLSAYTSHYTNLIQHKIWILQDSPDVKYELFFWVLAMELFPPGVMPSTGDSLQQSFETLSDWTYISLMQILYLVEERACKIHSAATISVKLAPSWEGELATFLLVWTRLQVTTRAYNSDNHYNIQW